MQEVSCGLDRCFLCRNCIPEWKEVIAGRKKTFLIRKGKALFRHGERVKGIFFLIEGFVKIHAPWAEEKDMIIRFAKAGDIVGHRGWGGEETYPITATALEDTTACFITNEFLDATLKTNPSLTYTLLRFYAAELQTAERRMRELTHMEVKGRIAGALLEILGIFGVNKERYISVPITRQDIASYAGTTYETVFKFFTELIRGKIISTSGKSIRINKSEQLKQYISER